MIGLTHRFTYGIMRGDPITIHGDECDLTPSGIMHGVSMVKGVT